MGREGEQREDRDKSPEERAEITDRILRSAESGSLTPPIFVSNAQRLLEVSKGADEVKTYLQTVIGITELAPQVQDILVDLLLQSCEAGQIAKIRKHYQTFQTLGLDQKPEVQQFLVTVKRIFPDVEAPSGTPDSAPTPTPPQVRYRRISRRAVILGGVGLFATAILGGLGGKAASDTTEAMATAQQASSANPAPTPPKDLGEIAPAAEILPPPNPHLGIRNDIVEIMEWVPRLGATSIRIDGGMSETLAGELKDYKVRSLLNKAKKMDLNVLYVFNPQGLLTPEEIERRLETILTSGAKITVELGNEPDVEVIDKSGLDIDYWRGDMTSFAQFIAAALQSVKKLKASGKIPPETKLVVAAPLKEENLKIVIQQLKNRELNPSDLTFAVHAYHTPEEVKRVAEMIKRNTGGKLMFTEIGVDSVGDSSKEKNVENLIKMYETARVYSQEPIFIHELPFHQPDPVTGEGFGFIKLNGRGGTPLPTFNALKEGTNNNVEKALEAPKATANP